MLAHTCNPNLQKAEQRDCHLCQADPGCIVSFREAWAGGGGMKGMTRWLRRSLDRDLSSIPGAHRKLEGENQFHDAA